MKRQLGMSWVKMLALALGIACTQSALAQTFKRVTVSGGATLSQISSGGASVWALGSNHHPYIYKKPQFVLANNISLTQIAVGGGNAAQADTVWGLDSAGRIYHAHLSGTSWVFSRVAGGLDLIAVGIGYQDVCHPYEVWGLNTGSEIYRYNFCLNSFDQEPGFLCDIHVGGGDIWGAECGPNTYRFNFSSGVFDPINSPFGAFPALTVGPNGEVWATDTGTPGEMYQYDPYYDRGFRDLVCCANQIQAGGDGVWEISRSNIYRREPSVPNWVHVPGSLVSISVGSGGGVWGLDSSGKAYAFSTP